MSPRTITYRDAIREGLREALIADPRVFLMGEDVGRYGGAFACSHGLLQEFGPERVRDAPLSESAFVGAGIGAAIGGMRPIVEIMTVNFSLLALDQIVNNAATIRHMSGGQFSVPLLLSNNLPTMVPLVPQSTSRRSQWLASHVWGTAAMVVKVESVATSRSKMPPPSDGIPGLASSRFAVTTLSVTASTGAGPKNWTLAIPPPRSRRCARRRRRRSACRRGSGHMLAFACGSKPSLSLPLSNAQTLQGVPSRDAKSSCASG